MDRLLRRRAYPASSDLSACVWSPTFDCIWKSVKSKNNLFGCTHLENGKHSARLNSLANGVVKNRPDFANQPALAIGPGPVGEQRDGYRSVPVNPKRTAAEAEVPNRARRKMLPGCGVLRRRIPAKRARTAFRTLPLSKELDGGRVKKVQICPASESVLRPASTGSRLQSVAGPAHWRKVPRARHAPLSTHAFSSCTSP